MTAHEPRRLLSYAFYAQAAVLVPLGLLVILWSFFPAILAVDAVVNMQDPISAVFAGGMAVLPLLVGVLILGVAGGQIAAGRLMHSGSRSAMMRFACVLSLMVPPLGPFVGVLGLLVVYGEAARSAR